MKLPPEKRNHLIFVIVSTLAFIGLIYYFLISPEQVERAQLQESIKDAKSRLLTIKKALSLAETNTVIEAQTIELLNQAEADLASGDLLSWTYDTIRRFKTGYHVEIPDIGQPVLGDVDVLANFPYKQIRISVMGSGYYHDIGKFICDLENKFPHFRVVNLTLDPANSTDPSSEKLSFHFEIIALVKSNN
jgi:Tfp pilus assembly protein PilO